MGRAPCCDKANVKRGRWSPEEDVKLKEYIEKYGTGGNWIALPHKAGLERCGKSCRLRWLNYLRPNINHGEFSAEEDRIICGLYVSIGSRWSIIAAQLPGRTDNDIKNYWNTKLKKKILGISPAQRKQYHHRNQQHQHHILPSFKSPTAPLPLATGNCYNPPRSTFTSLEDIPMCSDVISSITSPPFQAQMLQHQVKKNGTLLMFGAEKSCSSDDGSCTQRISYREEVDYEFNGGGGEQIGFENCLYGGVEEGQKLPDGCHEGAQMVIGNGLLVEAPSVYCYEESKLSNNRCSNLCLDDAGIGARAIYYY